MWELNKVYDISMQSIGDKENEEMIQNRLKSFTNGSLIHLVHFSCTINVIQLYNDTIYPF